MNGRAKSREISGLPSIGLKALFGAQPTACSVGMQVAVRHTACYAYHNLAVEQYRLGALPTMPCNVHNSAAMAALQRCRCSRPGNACNAEDVSCL